MFASHITINVAKGGKLHLFPEPEALSLQPFVTAGIDIQAAPISRYEKQDEHGNVLSFDALDHAILIDRVAGLLIDVRALHVGDHASCESYAAESTLAGRKWTLAEVDFLFAHVVTRQFYDPAIDPQLFPKIRSGQRIWSKTSFKGEDNPARPVYAWYVYSSGGLAYVSGRYDGGLALPVSPLASPSGQ